MSEAPHLVDATDALRYRIAALSARYNLPVRAAERLECLAQLLSGDQAPTAVHDLDGILNDHLADSLIGLELDAIRDARTIADLGSGAGLPGLVLAIAQPDVNLHLIESNRRKCDFLTRACDACSVTTAAVVPSRAEEWRAGFGLCDVVTARALAPLAVVAEYAAPLLRAGGALVAWRGRRDPNDESSAARAAAELGLEVHAPLPVTPYPGALHRHIHVMVKVTPTPARYPRRAGIARKRPLGHYGRAATPPAVTDSV